MNLSAVKDDVLLEQLMALKGTESKTTLSILYYLLEIDRRRLLLGLGYSSLFDYCVRKLKYSAGSAHRRIAGARIIGEHPELVEPFLEGGVTLCSLATAAEGLKSGRVLVSQIVGRSKREVESLVAGEATIRKEFIKPVTMTSVSAAVIQTSIFSQSEGERVSSYGIPEPSPVEVGKSVAQPVERYEIKFSVSKEVYQQFEEARDKLSNGLGGNLTVERVFSKLLDNYLKPKVQRGGHSKSNSRYIARSVRRAIYARDRGECAYVSPEGTKCCERRYLQIDHIKPYALGGKSDESNLRLLCAAHNRMLSRGTFGNKNYPLPVKAE